METVRWCPTRYVRRTGSSLRCRRVDAMAGWAFYVAVAGVMLLSANPSASSSEVRRSERIAFGSTSELAREAERQLGRALFFDSGLSADGSVSCASCHEPSHGYSSPHAIPAGVVGKRGARRPPSLLDVGLRKELFWDGRAESLETQALYPILGAAEMGNTVLAVESYVGRTASYGQLFRSAYGDYPITIGRISTAIAAFERSLSTARTEADNIPSSGCQSMREPRLVRGCEVFFGKGNCAACHSMTAENWYFTDFGYHNIGIGRRDKLDLGRFYNTLIVGDIGKFRTPSLRGVGSRPPYMHDGSMKTLAEVVDYFNKGGVPNGSMDPLIKPLDLSDQDAAELVYFLESL